MPGYPCCCESKCETCTCEACSDSPFYAPCCWSVVIAGIVDGTCDDCETLNRTYLLEQGEDGSSYTPDGCSWFSDELCGDCDPLTIWLSVFQEGSDYIIEVTISSVNSDDHVWRKNYGTSKPECCDEHNISLTHTMSSGDCNSSSATCIINAFSDSAGCNRPDCVECRCVNPPDEIAIDLTDFNFSNNPVPPATAPQCQDCADWNAIFVLTRLNHKRTDGFDPYCIWTYCAPEPCTVHIQRWANCPPDFIPVTDTFSVRFAISVHSYGGLGGQPFEVFLGWLFEGTYDGDGDGCDGSNCSQLADPTSVVFGDIPWAHVWRYQTQFPASGDPPTVDCMDLADPDNDNKVELQFLQLAGIGKPCVSVSPEPDPIYLWDANP